MVKPLTAAEKKWVRDLQKLLDNCPSKRLGAYTTGDPTVTIYDKEVFDKYRDENPRDHRDDVVIHDQLGTVLGSLDFPFGVDGVCG